MMTSPIAPGPEDVTQAPSGDEAETFSAPVAAIGGAKEGDTVTCKVVSIDSESGTATLAMAQDESEPAGGTDGMADEFNSPNASSAANAQPS